MQLTLSTSEVPAEHQAALPLGIDGGDGYSCLLCAGTTKAKGTLHAHTDRQLESMFRVRGKQGTSCVGDCERTQGERLHEVQRLWH